MFSIDPRSAILLLIGFVIAIAVHEFSHAAAARLLGDLTAQRQGRLTLNPIAHLDPMGTLMIVLTTLSGVSGFGWGKPVPYDPRAVRFGRLGGAIVAIAGPLSNFVLAVALLAIAAHVEMPAQFSEQVGARDFFRLAILNIGLCAFNMLPIPPLDGFGVLSGIAPWPLSGALERIAQYGPGILLILVFSANILPFRPPLLSLLLDPIVDALLGAAAAIANVS